MLGCIYGHLVLEVRLCDLDKSLHISYLYIERFVLPKRKIPISSWSLGRTQQNNHKCTQSFNTWLIFIASGTHVFILAQHQNATNEVVTRKEAKTLHVTDDDMNRLVLMMLCTLVMICSSILLLLFSIYICSHRTARTQDNSESSYLEYVSRKDRKYLEPKQVEMRTERLEPYVKDSNKCIQYFGDKKVNYEEITDV